MKTKSGFQTDGIYIKYQSGDTQMWVVEFEEKSDSFKTESEADEAIIRYSVEKELSKLGRDVEIELQHEDVTDLFRRGLIKKSQHDIYKKAIKYGMFVMWKKDKMRLMSCGPEHIYIHVSINDSVMVSQSEKTCGL